MTIGNNEVLKFIVSIFLSLIFLPSVYGQIKMDVSLIQEIGTDQNMVLRSELHSVEHISGAKKNYLKMQEGISFSFSASFSKDLDDYGPSSRISLTGSLFDHNEKLLKKIEITQGELELGQEKTISYGPKGGRRVEIILRPEVY